MEHIDFPGDFPSFETMMSVLKKVFGWATLLEPFLIQKMKGV